MNTTSRWKWAIAVALLGACGWMPGCAASSHILTGQQRPAIDPSQVTLYSQPPAEFEEVAIIEASSRNSWAITDQGKVDVVIERLKEQAAKLGANGVLLQMTGSESVGGGGVVTGFAGSSNPTLATGVYTQHLHKVGKALAIYIDESMAGRG